MMVKVGPSSLQLFFWGNLVGGLPHPSINQSRLSMGLVCWTHQWPSFGQAVEFSSTKLDLGLAPFAVLIIAKGHHGHAHVTVLNNCFFTLRLQGRMLRWYELALSNGVSFASWFLECGLHVFGSVYINLSLTFPLPRASSISSILHDSNNEPPLHAHHSLERVSRLWNHFFLGGVSTFYYPCICLS